MDESVLIKELKQGDQSALETIIDIYSSYVGAIVKNIIGMYMKKEDIEEVTSDVFVLLWNNAEGLHESCISLKSYIAAITRNQSLKKLRGFNPDIYPLEENVLDIADYGICIEKSEQREVLLTAISNMSKVDREIFTRYYFFMEKTAAIAKQMDMNESTVRSRLFRGRSYLKQVLEDGGYQYEVENIGSL